MRLYLSDFQVLLKYTNPFVSEFTTIQVWRVFKKPKLPKDIDINVQSNNSHLNSYHCQIYTRHLIPASRS